EGVLSAGPGQVRLVCAPGEYAWAGEQSEILVAGLRDSKYHIVGDLAELLPSPATEGHVPPPSLPVEDMLEAAVRATAALADRQYRGDIITSSSDLTVGMDPARRQPHTPGSPRRTITRLGAALRQRPGIRRGVARATRPPARGTWGDLPWLIPPRPGRRRG